MTWASRRRLLYGLAVLFVFLSIFGYTLFLKLYRPPSCVDGVQNQKEIGIDCEGPCSAVCPEHVQEPLVLWTRTFKASSGVFNAVAYIENPNGVFGNQQAAYLFKLYDDAGGLVKEIRGSTYILPNEKFVVFADHINTGARIPTHASFQFQQFSPWTVVDTSNKPVIFVRAPTVLNADTSPRLTAILQNGTLLNIPNVDVAAVLYDENKNAIAASATHVDELPKDVSYDLTFTWPDPLSADVARIEIIPRINLFK